MNQLSKRLDSLRQGYPYEAVFLLDASTRILISTDRAVRLYSQDREFAGRALEERRVLFAGLHRHPQGSIELDIVTPLLAGGRGRPAPYFISGLTQSVPWHRC